MSLLTISIFRLYRSYYFTLHGDGDALRYTKLLQDAEYLTLTEYLVFTLGLEPGSVILFYFFRGLTFFELNLILTGLYILCLLVLLFRIKHNHIILSFFILTSPVFLGTFFFGGVRQLSAMALFLLVISSRKFSYAVIATLLHKSGLVAFMLIRMRSYFRLFVISLFLIFLIFFLEDLVKIFFAGRENVFRAASLNPTSFLVGPLLFNLILLGSLPSLSSSQKFLVLLFFGFLALHPFILDWRPSQGLYLTSMFYCLLVLGIDFRLIGKDFTLLEY